MAFITVKDFDGLAKKLRTTLIGDENLSHNILKENNGDDVGLTALLGATNATAATNEAANTGLNALLKGIFAKLIALANAVAASGATAPANAVQMGVKVDTTIEMLSGLVAGALKVLPTQVVDAAGVPVTSFGSAPGTILTHRRIANASDAFSVKGSGGKLRSVRIVNFDDAPCTVKFFNKATSPVHGTDTPDGYSAECPAGFVFQETLPGGGKNFTLGIGAHLSRAYDTDAGASPTPVTTGKVVVVIGFE